MEKVNSICNGTHWYGGVRRERWIDRGGGGVTILKRWASGEKIHFPRRKRKVIEKKKSRVKHDERGTRLHLVSKLDQTKIRKRGGAWEGMFEKRWDVKLSGREAQTHALRNQGPYA